MSEFLTIAEASAAFAAKTLSPVELAQSRLKAIAAQDSRLRAFITVTEERALADARRAEAAIMAGNAGPLTGIPVGLKDIIETSGIATTCGSRILQGNVPDQDATAAARLKNSGTVLLGKLNTNEFASRGVSFNLPVPPALNPWDTSKTTGGSSSGAGAALAAGLVLGAIGSDTGGSIRIPASYCGLAGIKPTYGLVSRAGVYPAAFSLDHVGPLAWTVEDCAILLQAIAGADKRDPTASRRPVPDYPAALAGGVKGLVIGVPHHFHESDMVVGAETRRGIDDAIALFRQLGAEIRDVTLPPLYDWSACGLILAEVERAAAYEEWNRTRLQEFGQQLRNRIPVAALISGVDYVQATLRRRELCEGMREASEGCDLLLTGSTQAEAPPINAPTPPYSLAAPNLTLPFNLSGWPAISVCSGFSSSGLPTSIQIAAKPFQETTLFRAAHAYEKATPWRERRP